MTPENIFLIQDATEFDKIALSLFHYQAENNPIYKQYLKNIGCQPQLIDSIANIPFLPVELFKNHVVSCSATKHEAVFSSSGTSNSVQSQHYVKNIGLYETSFQRAFELFYGAVESYCILALLPAYLERQGSSLVYMANKLIQLSKQPQSGFYLHNHSELANTLHILQKKQQKILLLGVSFALWDFAEQFPINLAGVTIMETGGMKGRRAEITRESLHQILCNAFGVEQIHAEYGMTEMLSQAYSRGNGRFYCPPWLRILVREVNDPFAMLRHEQTGAICVIDLANWHSCSFLALSDLGKTYADGSFEVLGRLDNSDLRGCNLMVE